MNLRIAVALSTFLSLAASGASAQEVTTNPGVAALLGRLDAVRTVEVAYQEDVVTTKASAFRSNISTVEFLAKADRQTSSGWTLTVTRSGKTRTAVLLEIKNGIGRQRSFSDVAGTWKEAPDVVVIPAVSPVGVALGFLHREALPVAVSGEPASSPVRVDGRDTGLQTVVLSDADSTAVVCAKETGLVSFEGKSPRYTVRESVDEFRRDPVLGLVPVRRTVHSDMRGILESDSHMQLKELRINEPAFTLAGDDNTSAGILRQLKTP